MRCVCIKCDKRLTNFAEVGLQPSEGLAFVTYGHYGSTYFDPMNGTFLEITICDDCIKEAVSKNIVYKNKNHTERY